MKEYRFQKALPVWEKGKDQEMNYHLIFRSVIAGGKNTKIALTASSLYQMYINGQMVAEGPARAGHGYYRVDEIDITGYLDKEENVVAIYVAGYNVKNFYLIKQPAFLCAELLADGEVIAATGVSGFEAKYHEDRVRKVMRYSYQRTFTEVYRYDSSYRDFICDPDASYVPVELEMVGEKRFIERGIPYPCYDYIPAQNVVIRGTVTFGKEPVNPIRSRYVTFETPERGFFLEDLDIVSTDEVHKGSYSIVSQEQEKPENTVLDANTYAIMELPSEKTGFITMEVECTEDVQLMVTFDEILLDDDVSIHRMSAANTVIWQLKKGSYSLCTIEPYSLKYLKLINRSEASKITVKSIGLTEYAFDYVNKGLNSQDEELQSIYNAAVETFRQNTVDIYMDCPSRERAGWLCDSFFTSRVERALTGKSLVEKNFLENFIYTDGAEDINAAMFPMCYPSDFEEPNFIPQWAMWYVIELGEYLDRTGDRAFIDAAYQKVQALLQYFEGFENEDGLLEELEAWRFIEWSKANEFVNGVNYPTNMLYAKMLQTMGRLYGESYSQKGEQIHRTVREQSYFDGFFHDHALRQEDGTLKVVEEDVTETCQYYAFFAGTATRELYPALWDIMLNEFGPDRMEKGLWNEIYPSNAFIGNYLRLELLSVAGEKEKLLENIRGYFGYMAQKTGTLWEHDRPTASCNHGFASHVAIWLRELCQ